MNTSTQKKRLPLSIVSTIGVFVCLFAAYPAQAAFPTIEDIKSGNVTLDDIISDIPTEIEIKTQMAHTNLFIETEPKNYQANQNITVSLKSYLADIDRAYISWYVDEKNVTSGIGKTKINIKTKDAGTRTTIRVVVDPIEKDIDSIEKTIILYPTDFDVLWEADSYTPPFYKGKALYTAHSKIKLVAMPNFPNNLADNLFYEWEKNINRLRSESGYGRSVVNLDKIAENYGNMRIDVAVSTLDKSIASYRIFNIPSAQQAIIFYEDDPIEGVMYNRAVGKTFDTAKKEFTIVAEPYYFSQTDKKNGSLDFSWQVNNADKPGYEQKIAFTQEKSGIGNAYVKLAMRNLGNIYQSAREYLTINFNNSDAN
ncbi:MAG: hypothetical protein COZ49_02755 [Candidatus Yonathbacteria bacterium CG_4_10_14_3_um_filter_47_65]|uniref:Ig-like domain-containing protein n=2 Tax=Parcubacteria group TaxID=1794811 RepID=A0A2M8D5F4_9BACT|nr:MAG: hypothetical protein AUJ44_03250 [Candidatus Nomurabacteria bacterium CG1_02_47_685]PIP03751.1 MAG: hypothetical protein COX54_02545 [Candidatus Yonathbacteria bacterium CG23_combo_of_CG06-09_8_20_14_all_46_18]PIQ32769.1 MAG: hypothetical protein COW61_00970 [Candidatus Yonathbacteria bacterium CG17_big_fil_post_rev_8_21_14_2_50_46_19]PIX56308.1 MAG: hypothetical protein COZ49_02755 [Candidatus Yonathbacteria bacterium CG_4_10_14_3_um_filter_47_65]PIY57315.1 MAG: hypothetical protein CO